MKRSLDRYLYAIGLLKIRQGRVSAVDISRFLSLKPPTVSQALQQLQEQGYIIKEQGGNLDFSLSYREYADHICERVLFFREFLAEFGVAPSAADRDAVVLSWKLSNISYHAFRAASGREGREPEG